MPNLLSIQTTQESRVLRAFREVIQSVRDQATIQEIVRLLEVGNVDGVIELLQLDEATFEPLEEAIRQAYRRGGRTGAEQIGNIPIEAGTIAARFSMGLPTAAAWLADMSSRLITEIVEEQRQMVRERLTVNLARGVNPRQSALDLVGRVNDKGQRVGGFIGLTQRQAQWSANARNELEALDSNYFTRKLRDKRFDKTVRKAIRDEKPLTAAQVNRMVNAMQRRTLAYRGQVISRTESINALRAGQFEAIRQAAAKGGISLDEVSKSWDATNDARTRLDHLQMEQLYSKENAIPFQQAFVAPDGSRLMFPGDSSLGAPGAQTIQCFVPETPIAVSGLMSAIRREYSGQVVKLGAGSGVNLTVTPNHPVLTDRGWIAAGDIVKGDKLIDCGLASKIATAKPNVTDGVTTAEELYNAAKSLGDVNRVSRVVVNLHGEIPAQDVDVISVNGGLSDTLDSPVAQFCDEVTLAETDVSLVGLIFDRICNSAGIGSSGSSSRSVGGGSSLSPVVRTGEGSASNVAFTDGGGIDPKVVKASIYNGSGPSDNFGDSVNGLASAKHLFNDGKKFFSRLPGLFRLLGPVPLGRQLRAQSRDSKIFKAVFDYSIAGVKRLGNMAYRKVLHFLDGFVKFLSVLPEMGHGRPAFVDPHVLEPFSDDAVSQSEIFGYSSDSLSGLVEEFDAVEVDLIELYHYDGPVYNFETRSGMIVSGNTVSHNCRCRARYTIDFIGRQARVEGFS